MLTEGDVVEVKVDGGVEDGILLVKDGCFAKVDVYTEDEDGNDVTKIVAIPYKDIIEIVR